MNDSDCSPSCGNKLLEDHETCEAGTDKPCPESCDDGDPCSKDEQTGNAQTCNVVCTHTAINAAANSDGCCPSSANANNDDDCKPVCGNGTLEGDEACDDGNDTSGDGCSNCKVDSPEQRCLAMPNKIGDDECMLCNCQKCTDVLASCYAANNADEARACAALVDCGYSKGCSSTGCYCGNVNSAFCLLGQANGACQAQVETASKSKVPGEILSRSNDTNYAAGRANAVAQCMQNNCASTCGR
jgi:cysteine-rich repeat protein